MPGRNSPTGIASHQAGRRSFFPMREAVFGCPRHDWRHPAREELPIRLFPEPKKSSEAKKDERSQPLGCSYHSARASPSLSRVAPTLVVGRRIFSMVPRPRVNRPSRARPRLARMSTVKTGPAARRLLLPARIVGRCCFSPNRAWPAVPSRAGSAARRRSPDRRNPDRTARLLGAKSATMRAVRRQYIEEPSREGITRSIADSRANRRGSLIEPDERTPESTEFSGPACGQPTSIGRPIQGFCSVHVVPPIEPSPARVPVSSKRCAGLGNRNRGQVGGKIANVRAEEHRRGPFPSA